MPPRITFLLLAASALLLPTLASAADPKTAKAHECLLKFAAGNMPGARAAAAEVMGWSDVADPEAWRLGALCIQMATRAKVSWNTRDNGFGPVEWPVDGSVEAARSRTYDACVALLARDEVAALTNPVCSPIFLETGLPE